jgi:hypothetical protein
MNTARFLTSAWLAFLASVPAYSQIYQLRLYNADDTLTATISNSAGNNQQLRQVGYGQDTGIVDVTSFVKPGSNTIHLSLFNTGGGYTYGYDFYVNGVKTDSNSCGTAGVVGCNNNDQTHQNQIAYTHDISVNGPGTSPTVSYGGHFDGIATDCSHMFGWALDNNNSNATVSVDVVAAGISTVTVRAGDYRSDVGNHAWNLYNLQLYEDQATHVVHVYYSGTTQELPGSPQSFPPSDSQASTCGGGTSTSPIAVNWSAQPPSSATNGQSFSVGWNVTGAATRSRIIYGANSSPDSNNPQYSTPCVTGGNLSQQQSITLPSVNSSTVFSFVVEAQDNNGQNFLSAVAQSTVTIGNGSPFGRNLWIYSADQTQTLRCPGCDSKLTNFIVVFEKTQMSGYQQYSISLLADNLLELTSAMLSIVRTPGVTIVPTSTQVLKNANIPGAGLKNNILAGNDTGWADLSLDEPYIQANSEVLSAVHDVIGLLPLIGGPVGAAGGYVGYAVTLADLYNDVGTILSSSPSILPSTSMRLLMQDVNNNHVDNLMATRLRASFDFSLVFGVRFIALINDSAASPQFFLKGRNTKGLSGNK